MVKLKGANPDPNASGRPELIPQNEVVNVVLGGVEMREFEWDGEKRQRLKWEFLVKDDGPWQGKMIWGETSTNFVAHPNCKAYNWAAAMLGRQPDPEQGLDTDDLLGLPARILIHHHTDGKQRTWMRAKEVLPPRGGLGNMPQPQEPPF